MHENTSKQDLFSLKLSHHNKVQIYEREHETRRETNIYYHLQTLIKHGADIHKSQGHAHINNINNNQKHLTVKNTNLYLR